MKTIYLILIFLSFFLADASTQTNKTQIQVTDTSSTFMNNATDTQKKDRPSACRKPKVLFFVTAVILVAGIVVLMFWGPTPHP